MVTRLEKHENYIPKVKVDPDECFIVTEKYVLIYTRHFTQFICTCTKFVKLSKNKSILYQKLKQIPNFGKKNSYQHPILPNWKQEELSRGTVAFPFPLHCWALLWNFLKCLGFLSGQWGYYFDHILALHDESHYSCPRYPFWIRHRGILGVDQGGWMVPMM